MTVGQEMAQEGHFDANNILKASKECRDKYEDSYILIAFVNSML